jgi:hypothetical protein
VPNLSRKQRLILELLAERGEMYGLELVAASKRQLKRGTVYVTLGRMEEKGYIRSRLEDAPTKGGGLARRLYEPTPARPARAGSMRTPRTSAAGVRGMSRPGDRLHRLASRLCRPEVMARQIEPVIADLQCDAIVLLLRSRSSAGPDRL